MVRLERLETTIPICPHSEEQHMKRSWLIGAALVFSLTAVGCKDDDEEDPPKKDGGAQDAGRDAGGGTLDGGADGGMDAGKDGGASDAGDAGDAAAR